MKSIKTPLLLTLFLCFSIHVSIAQQAFQVHQDNVKPSMLMEYEKIAKEFNDAAVEHNLQTTWYTAMSNDFKYYYLTPIENFSELDENPMADMAKAMGDDFGKLFERFDKCYDSHGTYIIMSDDELSYTPEDASEITEDMNYRKWFTLYYTPAKAKEVREAMKTVKALYKSKNSKGAYRVYRNGFGQMDNYYMISISAKDALDYEKTGKEIEEALGSQEERWEAFSGIMANITRMEEVS